MTVHTPQFTEELLTYLRQINEPEHPVLAKIRLEMQQHRLGKMTIAPEQATFLTWLARLIQVENYLEIGTFTGYSSTAIALALPDHARLTCCDINVTFTNIAQQNWQKANVAHKITLELQPAIITMDQLLAQGKANMFDMAFIDADKPTTPQYFERCLSLIRSGGIIAIDNVLLGGRITKNQNNLSPSHDILRSFNAQLSRDHRIVPITLPLGDGLTLIQKK